MALKKIQIARLVAGVSLAGLAAPVFAEAAADSAARPTGEEIVVTGSRTTKNGDSSPTPLTVITTDTLTTQRPTSLTESVLVLPVFAGSRGQVSNPSANGGVAGGNGNTAQLNLRNLGGVRNLVLMDGRRVPPTLFTNIVDADVIPQLLIKRVDVVTGGVSAVYGSDAISGVVNFVTDTKFEGLKAQAQGGISKYGDDASYDAGLAYGTKFAEGRGHFEFSYEYRKDDGIMRRSDRPWFNRPVVVGNGSTVPYQLITGATLSAQPFGGRITCGAACPLNGQYFASNGVLSPFVNGTTFGGTTTQAGGPGGYLDHSLKAEQHSHQFYGRLDYDVSDRVHAFFSASYNYKHNRAFSDDLNLTNVVLSKQNAFLPAAYASQIASSTFTINEINNQNERFRMEPETRFLMFTGGLEGKLGNFDWSASYVHGSVRLNTTLYNNINNQKLSAALDAVNVGGTIQCYAATQAATAAAYANCKPLNLFGPTASSAAALAYVTDTTHYVAYTKQDDVNLQISGSPFSTWAGPVTAALSGEWRRQSFHSFSDALPTTFADCTNLRFNCVATGNKTVQIRQTFPSASVSSSKVIEAAAEATVPLLKDVPLVQALDLNGAARFTHYDTVGTYWTWKLGFDWHVFDDLRFRGTVSRDIRAPTLNDLFSPTSIQPVTNADLKAGAPAPNQPVDSVNISNPNLTAEIGKTFTLGAVYKPSYFPGFSLAVDYYDVKISNAILTLQGFQQPIQTGCYNNNNPVYCSLIVRNAAGQVVAWNVQPVNIAKITTYGLDFEANYVGHIGSHPLSLRALAAYQPHIRYIQPGVATIEQGDVAFGSNGITSSPSWRLTGMASFAPIERLRIDAMYRWRNSMALWGDPTIVWAAGQGRVRAYGQLSLNFAWTVDTSRNGKAEFFVNIQNVFNANPAPANSPGSANGVGGFGGFVIGDDVVGRYFTAGFRVKL